MVQPPVGTLVLHEDEIATDPDASTCADIGADSGDGDDGGDGGGNGNGSSGGGSGGGGGGPPMERAMHERRAREETKVQEPQPAAACEEDDRLGPGTAVQCRYGGQVCSRKPRRTRVLTNTLMRTPAHTLVHALGAPLSGKDRQQKREWDL